VALKAVSVLERRLLMEAQRAWHLDGNPLWTDDHVKKIVSVVAMQRLGQDQLRDAVGLMHSRPRPSSDSQYSSVRVGREPLW
jgi:hypothetical protein